MDLATNIKNGTIKRVSQDYAILSIERCEPESGLPSGANMCACIRIVEGELDKFKIDPQTGEVSTLQVPMASKFIRTASTGTVLRKYSSNQCCTAQVQQ